MSKTRLAYLLPAGSNVTQFLTDVASNFNLQVQTPYQSQRSFYDSFDWRLYHAGMLLELEQTPSNSILRLQNIKHLQLLMQAEMPTVPRFAHEFGHSDFSLQLIPLLEMRALLKVATVTSSNTLVTLLNNDGKIILRLVVEEFAQLPTRVLLHIVKGYDREVMAIIQCLQQLTLKAPKTSLLEQLMALQDKQIGAYSTKINFKFDPEVPAAEAVRQIFVQLLNTLQLNTPGCLQNIDSEFLHDYRVAIRRIRVALGQLKVLPPHLNDEYRAFFSWLGQITSIVRDLDVYLLRFAHYQQLLPISSRDDLEPLRCLLLCKQQLAYYELAGQLNSAYYHTNLSKWQALITIPSIEHTRPYSHLPIQKLADQRIWKIYRRIRQQARTISISTHPTILHELRKDMKKLRYLMEFFQSLYPKAELKHALKVLKSWQELLGDLQDYAVQEQAMQGFREEMRNDSRTPQATLLALGQLLQELAQQKEAVQRQVVANLHSFGRAKNHRYFKALFAPTK